MSIYLGTTKATKFPNGSKPLFFATEANNRLIYPDCLFRSGTSEYTAGGYLTNAIQAALHKTRSAASGLYSQSGVVVTEGPAGFWALINTTSSTIAGKFRYCTELKFSQDVVYTVGLGYAELLSSSSVYKNGVDIYVDSTWHDYDFTFSATLSPGGMYAPVLNMAPYSSTVERNAFCTFTRD